MAALPKVVSYEEWLVMPPVPGEEVVNGEIRTMPPNKMPHARMVRKLVKVFERFLDESTVEILPYNFGLVIRRNPLTCRIPDLALFRRDTMVEEDGYICSPPQLVVEVLSGSETRCLQLEKLQDYESIGVPEVWLVSPEACHIEVLLLQEGQLRTTRILLEGDLRPVHFPEACVQVASIWPV